MENRVKQIERWETTDGRWFTLMTAAHEHQEKLVNLSAAVYRLNATAIHNTQGNSVVATSDLDAAVAALASVEKGTETA